MILLKNMVRLSNFEKRKHFLAGKVMYIVIILTIFLITEGEYIKAPLFQLSNIINSWMVKTY